MNEDVDCIINTTVYSNDAIEEEFNHVYYSSIESLIDIINYLYEKIKFKTR